MKKYILLVLGFMILSLAACEEKTDLFDASFKNKTTHTKNEVFDQIHHFAELTTNNIPSITLDENYYPKQVEGEHNEPLSDGDSFVKTDLVYDNYSQKNLWINSLNEFAFRLENIYELLDLCEFEEGTTCEINTGYDHRDLTITMEENRLLVEVRIAYVVEGNERIEVFVFYAADIDNELYLEVDRYLQRQDNLSRRFKYIYYQNHYSKEYFEQNSEEPDGTSTSISIVDLTNDMNYHFRIIEGRDEVYAYGFYNYENDTYYSKIKNKSTTLNVYDGDVTPFQYNISDEITTSYNLIDVDNWQYIEFNNSNFALYKNDEAISGIDIFYNNGVGELYRKYTNEPNNGQLSLNDIGLNYDITIEQVNDYINENENYGANLFETLNIKTTYEANKTLFQERFTFTYTLDEIVAFLNDKIDQ